MTPKDTVRNSRPRKCLNGEWTGSKGTSVRGVSQKKIAYIIDKQLKKDAIILLPKAASSEKEATEQVAAKPPATNQDNDRHSNELPSILTPNNDDYYDLSDDEDDNKPPHLWQSPQFTNNGTICDSWNISPANISHNSVHHVIGNTLFSEAAGVFFPNKMKDVVFTLKKRLALWRQPMTWFT